MGYTTLEGCGLRQCSPLHVCLSIGNLPQPLLLHDLHSSPTKPIDIKHFSHFGIRPLTQELPLEVLLRNNLCLPPWYIIDNILRVVAMEGDEIFTLVNVLGEDEVIEVSWVDHWVDNSSIGDLPCSMLLREQGLGHSHYCSLLGVNNLKNNCQFHNSHLYRKHKIFRYGHAPQNPFLCLLVLLNRRLDGERYNMP